MITSPNWIRSISRDWMLLGAVAGLTVTSVYLGRIRVPSLSELEVLYILAVLLVTIKGLENGGIFRSISRDLQDGRFLALRLRRSS